jgi:hypothetical protein
MNERDHDEEHYNANLCPLCDYSPCAGDAGKGSCEAYVPTEQERRDWA